MSTITTYFKELYRDEKGLTTVEYAIAGGLVGAVVVTAFTNLGTAIAAAVTDIIASLS